MIELRRTAEFIEWLDDLRDPLGRALINKRLIRLANGQLGDYKSLGGDLIEFRLAYGPGYRLYAAIRGDSLVILLCGGDKGSQKRDILRSRRLAASVM